jgi:hypothetical protein
MRDALVVRLPFALPPLFQQNPFTSIPAFFGELLFYHCCYTTHIFLFLEIGNILMRCGPHSACDIPSIFACS